MPFRLFRRAPRSNAERIEPAPQPAAPAPPSIAPITEPPPDRFTRRRRAIDHGIKTIADESFSRAMENGAIAAVWRSLPNSGGDCLPKHHAHDGKVFLIRDSWAMTDGLVKHGPLMGELERPGHISGCNCFYHYVFSLPDLPEDLLTEKGTERLAEGKRRMAALGIKVTASIKEAP